MSNDHPTAPPGGPAPVGATEAGTAASPDDERSDVERRVQAAEQLPLEERADAFSALHDDLRTRLESGGGASA